MTKAREEKLITELLGIIRVLIKKGTWSKEDLSKVHRIHREACKKNKVEVKALSLIILSAISSRKDLADKLKQYDDSLVEVYPLVRNTNVRMEVCTYLGHRYADKGEHECALQFYFEGKKLSETVQNNYKIWSYCTGISNVLNRTGNYNDALRYSFDGLRICESTGDKHDTPLFYGNISNTYHNLRNYDLAIKYGKKCLLLAKQFHLAYVQGGITNNLGIMYREIGDIRNAEKYFKKSLKIFLLLKRESHLDRILCSMGIIYTEKKQYTKAMKILNECYDIARRFGKKIVVTGVLINMGEVLRQQGRYKEAIEKLQEGIHLMENKEYANESIALHKTLSLVYSDMRMFKEAYEQEKIVSKWEEKVRGAALLQSARATEVAETLYRLEKEQKELEERARKAEEEAKHKEEQLQEVTANLQQSMKTLKEVEEVVKPFLEQDDVKTKELANSIYKSLSKTIKAQRSQKPEKYFDKSYQEYIRRLHKACEALTPMEIKVCILIKLNYSNKQIGEVMNVSELTVKTHRARIRRKMSLIPQENLLSVLLRI